MPRPGWVIACFTFAALNLGMVAYERQQGKRITRLNLAAGLLAAFAGALNIIVSVFA